MQTPIGSAGSPMTIGIGVVCEHGDYVLLASDKRASYKGKNKNLNPNDEIGKMFDFDPLRLACTAAGTLSVMHDLVGEISVRLDKLAKDRKRKPIYREHIENSINDGRLRQIARRIKWAAHANYGITWNQLLTGKLPHGKLDRIIWSDVKQKVLNIPFPVEIIVAGFTADEPVLFKASDKEYIQGDADPPVFVIGSTGARYAMEHLNRRGQNIFSSLAQTVLHLHEAMDIARKKDEDGYIGRCDSYVVLNRHRQGFEQFPHKSDLLRGWCKYYAARESTASLKSDVAVTQAQMLLRPLAPGVRFERYRNNQKNKKRLS
jgi:20S proteasome alpha/beta subunit